MRARSLTPTRLTLLVLAVTGIVVGLLAMHTMTLSPSEGDHSTMSTAATSAMPMDTVAAAATSTFTSTTGTSPSTTTHGEPAGGGCGTDCMALQMTCVLSLLVIGAMLLRGPTAGHNLLPTLLASMRTHVFSRVAPRRAPSLDVLCISRT